MKTTEKQYMDKIITEFEMNYQNVVVRKNQLKISYEQYYNRLVDKMNLVQELQDICVLLRPRDIKDAFKHAKQPNSTACYFFYGLFNQNHKVSDKIVKNCELVKAYLDSKK